MFRKLAALTVLALATAAPASAQVLTRLPDFETGGHAYMAFDSQERSHHISIQRKDRDGDFLIEVSIYSSDSSIGAPPMDETFYWVSCARDEIQVGGGWKPVNHNQMEGHYYDAACRPSVSMSIAEEFGLE